MKQLKPIQGHTIDQRTHLVDGTQTSTRVRGFPLFLWQKYRYLLLPLFLCTVFLAMGYFLVQVSTMPVNARTAPSSSESVDHPVKAGNFPTITVQFVCDAQRFPEDYILVEDGVRQEIVISTTEPFVIPSQITILLDFFVNKEGDLPPAATELIEGEDRERNFFYYLNEFGDKEPVDVPEDLINIFVPDKNLQTTRSILASNAYTSDLNSLYYAKNNSIDRRLGLAHLLTQSTTSLVDLMLELVEHPELDPTRRQTLILFSDGTDMTSSNNLNTLFQKANERDIRIDTVYIETYRPGNLRQLELMAAKTGGTFLTTTQTSKISELLTDAYQDTHLCTVQYRTIKTKARQIEIRRRGSRSAAQNALATSQDTTPDRTEDVTTSITLIPGFDVAVAPPTATLLSPQPSTILTVSNGSTDTVGLTSALSVSLRWGFAQYTEIRTVDQISVEVIGGANDFVTSLRVSDPQTLVELPRGVALETVPTIKSISATIYISVDSIPLTVGNYLVKASVVDNYGLIGTTEEPFGVRVKPTPEEMIPTESRWSRVSRWINNLFGFSSEKQFTPLEFVLWLAVAMLLSGVLLYWYFRSLSHRHDLTPVITQDESYTYALVRVRTSPEAPPLLQTVHLTGTISNEKSQGRNGVPYQNLSVPDCLYHPLRKRYYDKAKLEKFSEQFDANFVWSGKELRIERNSLLDPDRPRDEKFRRREPISVQIALTTQPIVHEEIEKEFCPPPLDDGDVIHLGETHYKVVALQPQPKEDEDDKDT